MSIMHRFRDITTYIPKTKEDTSSWTHPFKGNLSRMH